MDLILNFLLHFCVFWWFFFFFFLRLNDSGFRQASEAPFGRKLSLEGRGSLQPCVCVAGAPRLRGAGGDDAAEGWVEAGKHLHPAGRP